MSCGGCGGRGGLPPSVTLRLEAVRMALGAGTEGFEKRAEHVYIFVTSGIDMGALDHPSVSVPSGDSADAVAMRNALLVQPLSRVFGVQGKIFSDSIRTLADLVQSGSLEVAKKLQGWNAVNDDLVRYGLHIGMSTDELRDWVLRGKAV